MSNHIPSFTIKAKDRLAIEAIQYYSQLCSAQGLIEQAAQVNMALGEIDQWQQAHPEQVQAPDHKHIDADEAAVSGHRVADTLTVVREPGDGHATLYIDGVKFPYCTVDGVSWASSTRGGVEWASVAVRIPSRCVRVEDEMWEFKPPKGRTEIHVETES